VVSNVSALPQGGELTINGTGSVVLSSGLGVSSVSQGSVSSGVANVSRISATPTRRIPPWVANRMPATVSQPVATVSQSTATTTAPAIAVSQPVATTSQVVAATSQPVPVIRRTSFSIAQTPATVIQSSSSVTQPSPVNRAPASASPSLIDAKAHDVVLQSAIARPDALEMAWLWDLMQSARQRRSTGDDDLTVRSLDEVLAQYGQ
jgi:hypothetical protein